MGIRFYCPNGHKLNVKEFQAGRRGICPFCGARIQIPTQSTRPSSKSAGHKGAAPTAAHSLEQDDLESAQGSDSSPDILPGEPPSLPGDPSGGTMLGPSTPLGTPAVSGPVVAPPATPAVGANLRSAATQSQSPASAPSPVQPTPAASAAATTGPAPAAVAGAAASPGPALKADSTAPTAVPTAAPAAAPEPADPIAEAPEMIWYVRPPSGGQFGPAAGDLMRTWLSEGRVSADSLVWREGWRDWQEAGAVFPKLRSNNPIDFLETAPVPTVAVSAAAHAHRPKVKRSSDRSQIVLLAVLSLAVVILLFVFLWVLLGQQ